MEVPPAEALAGQRTALNLQGIEVRRSSVEWFYGSRDVQRQRRCSIVI